MKTSTTYTHGKVCFEESEPDRADLEIGRFAIGRFADWHMWRLEPLERRSAPKRENEHNVHLWENMF